VLNQFIREPSYYIVGFVWKLRGCCRSKKSKPPVLTNEPKQISSSSKTVLFIRHGQGDHNASLPGWNLVDPPLNATGLGQARDLHERLGGTSGPLKDVEVVLVSPLTRAFQTAQGAFGHGPAFQNREPTLKPKWVVCPLLRERMGAPCDEGRPKAQLAMTMPEMKEMEGFDTMKPDVWWTPHFEFGLYDRIAQIEDSSANTQSHDISRVFQKIQDTLHEINAHQFTAGEGAASEADWDMQKLYDKAKMGTRSEGRKLEIW